jgi:fibronectin type 3 domain-containing protein
VQRATVSNGTVGAYSVIATVTTAGYVDGTVADASTYSYQIVATNNTGSSTPSNALQVTTPLAPPSNLVPTVALGAPFGPAGVILTWSNAAATTATGITIQRAGNIGFSAGLITANLPLSPTTYNNTSAVANATYYYRIRATKGAVTSAWVNATIFPFVPTVPAAPSQLQILSVTRNSVTVSFADNANNEGGFTVMRSTNSNFTQNPTSFNVAASAGIGGTVTYTFTGLIANQRYYFRVRSFNGVGTSVWVNGINTVTLK